MGRTGVLLRVGRGSGEVRYPPVASSPLGACATALIDRIILHADIITIEGQSYRRRAAEESAAARKTKAKR